METIIPESEPVAEPPPKQDLRKTWIIAGAATIIALAAAIVGVKALDKKDNTPVQAASSNSPTGAFAQRPTAGTITDINGSSFTVKATDFNGSTSNVKVTTSRDTTYSDSVEGAVSDLKKGDTVIATGTTTDGVFTATRITEAQLIQRRANNGNGKGGAYGGDGPGFFTQGGPPPGADNSSGSARIGPGGANGENFATGEIQSISGDTITVATPDGSTSTIKTTSATKVIVNKTIKFKDLKVGDTVRVTGDDSKGTVSATEVTRGDVGGGFFGGPGGFRRSTDTTTVSN